MAKKKISLTESEFITLVEKIVTEVEKEKKREKIRESINKKKNIGSKN